MEKTIGEVVQVLEGFMKPFEKGEERKYRIFADGKEIFPETLRIEGHGECAWMLGTRPEGWQGLLYREVGGGGSVTVPWVRMENGDILVGMVHEKRPNMGESPVWCAIGGMITPGETREQARLREGEEESGMKTHDAHFLPGPGVVQDRLFYIANIEKGEGVQCFGKEYSMDILEPAGESVWRPKLGTINHKKESLTHFFHLQDAALMTSDSLMMSAILKLAIKLGVKFSYM
ncbi:MAG: NUDIX domain-containing protein [Patescibacteria group bacterium]